MTVHTRRVFVSAGCTASGSVACTPSSRVFHVSVCAALLSFILWEEVVQDNCHALEEALGPSAVGRPRGVASVARGGDAPPRNVEHLIWLGGVALVAKVVGILTLCVLMVPRTSVSLVAFSCDTRPQNC